MESVVRMHRMLPHQMRRGNSPPFGGKRPSGGSFSRGGGSGKPEYYDRAADVGAQTDRAATEPVRFAELPKLFDDWNAEQVEPGPNPKILTHLGDWPTRPLATCQARRGTSMWKWCTPRRSNCLSVMSSMSARTLATIFAATSRWCFSRNDSK